MTTPLRHATVGANNRDDWQLGMNDVASIKRWTNNNFAGA